MNTIKKLIGIILIFLVISIVIYGITSNNYNLAYILLLLIQFFIPILKVEDINDMGR